MAEQTAEEAYAKARRVSFPPWESFLRGLRAALDAYLATAKLRAPAELYIHMLGVAVKSYEEEFINLPPIGSGHHRANRDFYNQRIRQGNDQEATLDRFTRQFLTGFLYLLQSLPSFRDAPQPFTLPITDLVKDRYGLFQKLQTYMPGDAVETLLKVRVPYGILPDEDRFRHTWIIAPSGTGKTTLIENLINCDLARVGRGEASVFVMDSQNEMIPRLAAMKEFHEDGPLKGKLIVLEPSADFPLALNLFDNQLEDIDQLSSDDRAVLYASSLEMADFVMSGLLGATLTSKQKGIFRYISQALQVIPDATILTFADMLLPGGYDRYARWIRTLHPYTVKFYETRFNSPSFTSTKEEILWRLDTIMSDTTFRLMFSHPQNKFNLDQGLQSAKVICVNTNSGLLSTEGSSNLGRYFLALLLQATQRRMLIDKENRLPTFCYIDEANEYIANEPKMATLLDKARKQKVGFILAHLRMANIVNSDVADALANCRTKIAAQNQTDASYLAKLFRVEPEFLSQAPRYHFAVNTGGPTVMAGCPPSPFKLDATPAQLAAFRDDMRKRFTAPPEAPAPEHAGPTTDGGVIDPARDAQVRPNPARGFAKPADESDAATDW